MQGNDRLVLKKDMVEFQIFPKPKIQILINDSTFMPPVNSLRSIPVFDLVEPTDMMFSELLDELAQNIIPQEIPCNLNFAPAFKLLETLLNFIPP